MADNYDAPDETKIVIPIIQTLNIILQKVIQVNKPTEYYKN